MRIYFIQYNNGIDLIEYFPDLQKALKWRNKIIEKINNEVKIKTDGDIKFIDYNNKEDLCEKLNELSLIKTEELLKVGAKMITI